ncbi:TusE/DsrC/DsvC family sulfur relay protein [bacterium]|nr:TusE/DsrC/DsvC family sulfur relay protein [bacterium]
MIMFDSDGYLKAYSQWNEALANTIAKECHIELTDTHWAVIRTLRAFYEETQLAPPMRVFVKLIKTRLGADTGNSITLHQLFPPQPAKIAAKMAGLPRPTHCL